MKNVHRNGKIIAVIILSSLLLFLFTGSCKMTHGAPDNYEVQQKAITYRLDDMAELAVRLGSPDIFHRLGDVVFIDSFENGLKRWGRDTYEGLATVEVSAKRHKTGGFSCMLISPDGAEDYCGIYTGSSFYIGGKIGFEYSFAGDTYGKNIKITISIYDGENVLSGAVLINNLDKTLSYLKPVAGFTVFETGIKVVQEEHIWNTWKLIIDMDTEEYVKLILNQNVYTLTGKDLTKAVNDAAPFILVRCSMQQLQDTDTTLYIDDCILTQNEP